MLEIYRELATFERLPPPDEEESVRLGAMIFDAGRLEGLVAEVDGSIEGMAIFSEGIGSSFRARPMVFLEDLAVSERVRSRGVGAALMAAVAREGVARGALRIEWAVLDWNVDAMRFYRRLGGAPRQTWVQYVLEEDAMKRLAAGGSSS